MVELNEGDFVYQSDQELFLIVLEEDEDSYLFAAHGWRNIDKERIEQYVEDSQSKVHRQSEIEKLIEEQGDDETTEQYDKLQELFDAYSRTDVSDDGPEKAFAMDEDE